MKRAPLQSAILLIAVCLLIQSTATAQSADEPVVKAVLFYSPTCGHCHYVITEVLVPMVDEYGDQLQIVGIDTSQSGGAQLYQAAIERYQIPAERRGVPTLVVGDVVLVGGLEIPEQFPALLEEGLAAGGIDWPDIPGLTELLSGAEPEPSQTSLPPATATPLSTAAAAPSATTAPISSPSATPFSTSTAVPSATTIPVPSPTTTPAPSVLAVGDDEIPSGEAQDPPPDPVGFTVAGAVLPGMVAAFLFAARRVTTVRRRLLKPSRNPVARAKTWAIPLLVLLGLGVAAYLAYVEVGHVEAVCGPVGECNTVQASAYAVMLGVPVAVWGVLNYLAVGVLWAGQRYLSGRWANPAALALLGLTLFGTLFSIYLTCLELFVIRAICAWCLSSAAITAILMLLVVVPITGGSSRGREARARRR